MWLEIYWEIKQNVKTELHLEEETPGGNDGAFIQKKLGDWVCFVLFCFCMNWSYGY